MNPKPRLFIGSSSEGLPIAHVAEQQLQSIATTSIWTDAGFTTGRLLLEEIEKELKDFDFALLVASPDDLLVKRDQVGKVMRDNVLFEFGFFIGILGRRRTFLLVPDNEALILPSDISGLLTATYSHLKDKTAELRGCASICNAIEEEWQNEFVERESRARKALESRRSQAIVALFRVTSGVAEVYRSPNDVNVFTSLQEKAFKEIDKLIERFKDDAKLVGIETEFDALIAVARDAASDLPPPDELWEHYKRMREVVVMRFDPFVTYAYSPDSLKRWYDESGGKIPREWFAGMGLSLQFASDSTTPREKTISMIENLAFYTIGAREAVIPLQKIEDRYRNWWRAHQERLSAGFDRFHKALIAELIKQLDPYAPRSILHQLLDNFDKTVETPPDASSISVGDTANRNPKNTPWWKRILH
jgi:hypothetical protein